MVRLITQITKRVKTNVIKNLRTTCLHDLNDNVSDNYRKLIITGTNESEVSIFIKNHF